MTDKNERTKTIKFNMNNPWQRELWEFLQTLPHGSFSEETKLYWAKEMMEGKTKGETK